MAFILLDPHEHSKKTDAENNDYEMTNPGHFSNPTALDPESSEKVCWIKIQIE